MWIKFHLTDYCFHHNVKIMFCLKCLFTGPEGLLRSPHLRTPGQARELHPHKLDWARGQCLLHYLPGVISFHQLNICVLNLYMYTTYVVPCWQSCRTLNMAAKSYKSWFIHVLVKVTYLYKYLVAIFFSQFEQNLFSMFILAYDSILFSLFIIDLLGTNVTFFS